MRPDSRPNAWYEWDGEYLRLKDFGHKEYHNLNCFDAVALKVLGHKIGAYGGDREDFKAVMEYITENGIKSSQKPSTTIFRYDLIVETRPLSLEEKVYFSEHGITEQNLLDDGVTGVEMYKYNSKLRPTQYTVRYPQDKAVALWKNGRVKVYRPDNKEMKFSTNTIGDDYYVFGSGGTAYGFEGYKDARAACNLGFNTFGLQSSTVLPTEHGIAKLKHQFDELIWIGDWDKAGKENGANIAKRLGIAQRSPDWKIPQKDIAAIVRTYGPDRAKKAMQCIIS